MQQDPKKAVVIGAGMGGLAAAIRLAVQGFDVQVYEKNATPGGKMGYLEQEGYHFDTGPSLFTQPQNLEDLFALAGEPMDAYLRYRSLPVSCNYFYEDGTRITAFTDAKLFDEELSNKNGEAKGKLQRYLQRSEKLYQRIGQLFLNHSLHKRSTLFKTPIVRALTALRWPYLFRTLHQVNTKHFTSSRTVQLFNRYATYNGSNPYQAPGMLSLIPHLEHNEGTFYPEGGMISIARALHQLAVKKGVQFHFNTKVQRIIHAESRVKGVVVDGQNIEASIVVSNVDVYFTYKQLLQNEIKASKLLKQERSSSALIFYWGIQHEFEQLDLHNIFFSKDYQAEFTHLFQSKNVFDDPTVYVNITSKSEPGIQAPNGKENWFVMVNVPANIGQDWESYRMQYRAAIIQKLNRLLQVDLETLIEIEAVLDPVSIESQTDSFRGSLYGTSSNSKMAAFLRHPNFTSAIKGLYFVGGSVHPGGGIPLCLKSAQIVAELVAAQLNRHSPQTPTRSAAQ